MKLEFAPYELVFKEPAGTSRGVMLRKKTYFLRYSDPDSGISGYGEAAIFEGLSPEAGSNYENILRKLSRSVSQGEHFDISDYSSVVFGFEQAKADFENGGKGIYFDSPFISRHRPITINGLIWMGTRRKMLERIENKLQEGFGCIKIKIGAIDWDDEIAMLKAIRDRFSVREIELRVDANGAFSAKDCLEKLDRLSRYDIHSIEQPIKPGNWKAMSELCEHSPVPIALDEELIEIKDTQERERMLETIKPQYIILKPALCFGFSGASSWIKAAEQRNVGWWITSALESSVGLDAIAQYTGLKNPEIPQGLGTGALYENNFSSPLTLEGDKLFFNDQPSIFRKELEQLTWISE